MKKSIVWKIFRNTFIIFAVLLSIQLIFQLLFFNQYYTRYKINSLKSHLSELVYDLEQTPPSSFDSVINSFADTTNSTNAVISTVEDTILDDYNLTKITITNEQQNNFTILLPFKMKEELYTGDEITLTGVLHKEDNLYLATTIKINEQTYSIYRTDSVYSDHTINQDFIFLNQGKGLDKQKDKVKNNSGKGNNPVDESNLSQTDLDLNINVFRKILSDFNTQEELAITGTITSVDEPSYRNETLFTMELMNYYLDKINGEIDDYTLNEFTIKGEQKGFYYFSETEIGRNIVFINTISNNGVQYDVFTVISLQQTDEIIELMTNFNYVLFGIILILLILSSLLHSKVISKPLVALNRRATEIANLNFESSINHSSKRTDEIGQLEQSLNIVSANLSSSLSKLQEQNRQLKDNLEIENQNEQLRKDFVAGLSHEIKTPLAVIQASSEALLEDIFTEPIDQKEQLNVINKEVIKTNKLINEMVQIYRLDRPSYEVQFVSFDISSLIEAVVNELKPLAVTKAITFNLNLCSVCGFGDQDKIEMVISNFVTNAIKYTNNGETINISLSENHNDILFEIENTGAHIAEDQIKQLFEPFYRLDNSRSRHLNSSGLGLHIVSLILKQHNSEYGAYNSDDGVIFYFTLKKSDI